MAGIAISGDFVEVSPYTTGASGTQIDPAAGHSQSFVTINGVSVLVQGDYVPEHVLWGTGIFGGAVITDTHGLSTLVSSQSFVTINGTPVIMDGDRSSCDTGHTVIASTTISNIS